MQPNVWIRPERPTFNGGLSLNSFSTFNNNATYSHIVAQIWIMRELGNSWWTWHGFKLGATSWHARVEYWTPAGGCEALQRFVYVWTVIGSRACACWNEVQNLSQQMSWWCPKWKTVLVEWIWSNDDAFPWAIYIVIKEESISKKVIYRGTSMNKR